jgi:hypothetical protein
MRTKTERRVIEGIKQFWIYIYIYPVWVLVPERGRGRRKGWEGRKIWWKYYVFMCEHRILSHIKRRT